MANMARQDKIRLVSQRGSIESDVQRADKVSTVRIATGNAVKSGLPLCTPRRGLA